MPTVRLLPFASAAGPAHMAADDALLHAAAECGAASLRFYTWAAPTLSLGYFQPAADRLTDPLLAGLPWVRRATGGAALVHHHELTYALALPPGSDWQPRGESMICRVHHAITAALAPLGVPTRSVLCGDEQKLGPVLCFLHQTAGDLVAECGPHSPSAVFGPTGPLAERADHTPASKVVGSAQRKQKGALLQHGGVLLARSAFAPQLPGLAELTGVTLPPDRLSAALAARFAADFGWTLTPADWTADERQLAARIERERYADPGWNAKR